jgi:hypothetical protein
MKDIQVETNSKQVRFIIWIGDNEFVTDWKGYNVVDFTNRCTSLVAAGHTFTVEQR